MTEREGSTFHPQTLWASLVHFTFFSPHYIHFFLSSFSISGSYLHELMVYQYLQLVLYSSTYFRDQDTSQYYTGFPISH